MTLMNLATVFGPSLLRPPVAKLGSENHRIDISQEVVVQVGMRKRKKLLNILRENDQCTVLQ